MEWLESNAEILLFLVGSVVNCIFTILSYRRTGVLKYLGTLDQSVLTQKETLSQASVVNNDLQKLIEYHENTVKELKAMQTNTGGK